MKYSKLKILDLSRAVGENVSDLKKKINYTVVCVNEFANRYNISSKEAFEYLYDHKGIEFIKENYDIEHTLSFDDAVDDLTLVCRNNGGNYGCFCTMEVIRILK